MEVLKSLAIRAQLEFEPRSGAIATVLVGVAVFAVWATLRRGRKHLPPGPKGIPLLGNVIALSKAERPHLLFADWCREYGKIVHLSVFGKSIILVDDLEIANDLLEKRSVIYSDRPNMVLENEILGWGAAMPSMRYGKQFRKHRRLSQALLNPSAAKGYGQMHEDLAVKLLQSIAERPNMFVENILVYATATIFKLTYDLEITGTDDPMVKLMNEAIKGSSETFQASGSLVDIFPSLKWVYGAYPTWAPFSGFKVNANRIRDLVLESHKRPFDLAVEKIRAGTMEHSIIQNAISMCGGLESLDAEDEYDIRGLTGVLYAAGQETTTATLTSFVMAMVLYPDVQAKAQAEIDSIVSHDRLPNMDDRPNLPYVEALLNELYRWGSPLVISIPHDTVQDDYYNGYYIPKGSSVIALIREMMYQCPRPDEFIPERFIDGANLGKVPVNPREAIFGFGRRRCPGMYLADNSAWTVVAQMLASFNFSPEVVDGKPKLPAQQWGIEMARLPEPFGCVIQLRDERKHLVIKE